ncbi:AAA family ATPase [Rhodobacter capsulatus]
MTKVRKITISRFRGARFELPLDFSKNTKSVAIFGENASGKSTITDALEWFIHDRVDHLWREDCKQDSLRNVLADNKPSSVEMVFDGTDRNGTKALSDALKTSATFANDNSEQLVADLKGDNIILRHADIVNFLDKTKGGKREAIADIIGYSEITKFRNVLFANKEPARKRN